MGISLTMTLPEIERPIFISYSERDFRVVLEIYRLLRADVSGPPTVETSPFHDVFFNMPDPERIPADLRGTLDYYIQCKAPLYPVWQNEVLPFIGTSACKSVLVVLTKHSRESPAVGEEFRVAFHKPLWVMQINGEPLPANFASHPNMRLCHATINLPELLNRAMRASSECAASQAWTEAYALDNETLDLLDLLNPSDAFLRATILGQRAVAEIRLGLIDDSCHSLQTALNLLESLPEGPAHTLILRDLGCAHMAAADAHVSNGALRSRHITEARQCWQRCLQLLLAQRRSLKALAGFPFKELEDGCRTFLRITADYEWGG